MNLSFKVALMMVAGIVAALIGAAVFFAVNFIPTLVWGEGIILVSAYFTIPIGGLLGVGVFALTLMRAWGIVEAIPTAHGNVKTVSRLVFSLIILFVVAAIFIAGVVNRAIEISWMERVSFLSERSFEVHRTQSFNQRGWKRQVPENRQITTNKLTFGPEQGGVKVEIKTQLVPLYLGMVKGHWYLVLGKRPSGYPSQSVSQIEVERWGNDFNDQAQRLSVLRGATFSPISWKECPEEIVATNLLIPALVPLSEMQSLAIGPVEPDVVPRLMKEYFRTHLDFNEITIGRSGSQVLSSISSARAAFEKSVFMN